MKEVVDAMPIVRAWRAMQRRGDKGAKLLAGLIALYVVISLLTPVSARLQRGLLAAQHFRPFSFGEWAVLQLAPKMYGSAHRVWRGPIDLFDPKRNRSLSERAFARAGFWVNHYPARMARFDGSREKTLGDPRATRYVYLRSSYRGTILESGFSVRAADGRMFLTLMEDRP